MINWQEFPTCMVESMSEMPHSRKKSPLTNSADPTTGTLMVVTISVSGPTDMFLWKYQYLTLLYDTVPSSPHSKFTFFSTSLNRPQDWKSSKLWKNHLKV